MNSSYQPFNKDNSQGYCNYQLNLNNTSNTNNHKNQGHYKVDKVSNVIPEHRDNSPETDITVNYNPVNGGLYSGPQNNNPWNSIHIVPTATNYIQLFNKIHNDVENTLLRHQPSLDRLNNNYSAKPNLMWYNPKSDEDTGLYRIIGFN